MIAPHFQSAFQPPVLGKRDSHFQQIVSGGVIKEEGYDGQKRFKRGNNNDGLDDDDDEEEEEADDDEDDDDDAKLFKAQSASAPAL